VRNFLPGLAIVVALFTVWAVGYQSSCERELARAQGEAASPMFVRAARMAASMPTTGPVVLWEEEDCR
jgi:hypothetical protein